VRGQLTPNVTGNMATTTAVQLLQQRRYSNNRCVVHWQFADFKQNVNISELASCMENLVWNVNETKVHNILVDIHF
jgi:hypothetical protein